MTAFCAPSPIAIIVMTDATPMMMPSIVNSARSLLANSAASAVRKLSLKFIGLSSVRATPTAASHSTQSGIASHAFVDLLGRELRHRNRRHLDLDRKSVV